MERTTLDSVLDVLSEHIALLDGGGRIVAVNRRWLQFARENGGADDGYVGTAYLDVCRAAAERGSPEAAAALEGVGSVLRGGAESFTLEYACHAPSLERWFILNATRMPGDTPGVVVSHVDISRRKRTELELAQSNRELERHVSERTRQVAHLAGRLIEAEQAERARVSRGLHDGLQQELFAAQFALASARRALAGNDADAVAAQLAETERWLRTAIRTTRQAAVELTPPVLHARDIDEAFAELVREMRERHDLRVALSGRAHVPDPSLRSFLYGVARELLFNVVKHAGVSEARLDLRSDDGCFVMTVEDDGRGLAGADLAAHSGTGLGLKGLQARLDAFGGSLELRAPERGGTRVEMRLPAAVLGAS